MAEPPAGDAALPAESDHRRGRPSPSVRTRRGREPMAAAARRKRSDGGKEVRERRRLSAAVPEPLLTPPRDAVLGGRRLVADEMRGGGAPTSPPPPSLSPDQVPTCCGFSFIPPRFPFKLWVWKLCAQIWVSLFTLRTLRPCVQWRSEGISAVACLGCRWGQQVHPECGVEGTSWGSGWELWAGGFVVPGGFTVLRGFAVLRMLTWW